MGKYAEARSKAREAGKGPGAKLEDVAFERDFPALWDLMVTNQVKGKPRKTLSVTVFCEEGFVKACVNDREAEEVAFVTSGTFVGLIRAIEEGLESGKLDWRASRGFKGRRGGGS